MEKIIFSEGGINWNWYTELTINADNTVTIHRHWRLHRYDESQGALNHPANAIAHPHFYHDSIWQEDDNRTALEYYIPNSGWKKIQNPQHIFAYDVGEY
jgi:hypothetical protein